MTDDKKDLLFDTIGLCKKISEENFLNTERLYDAMETASLIKSKGYGKIYQMCGILSHYADYLTDDQIEELFGTDEYNDDIYGSNLDYDDTCQQFAKLAAFHPISNVIVGARTLQKARATKIGFSDISVATDTLTNVYKNIFPFLKVKGSVFCDDICLEMKRIFAALEKVNAKPHYNY